MGTFKRLFKGILKKILSPTGVLYDAPPIPTCSLFKWWKIFLSAWKWFQCMRTKRVFPFVEVETVGLFISQGCLRSTFMFSLDHLGKRAFLISFQFPKIFQCQTNFGTNNINNNRSSREFIFPPLIISSFSHYFKNVKQLIKCMNLMCQGKNPSVSSITVHLP